MALWSVPIYLATFAGQQHTPLLSRPSRLSNAHAHTGNTPSQGSNTPRCEAAEQPSAPDWLCSVHAHTVGPPFIAQQRCTKRSSPRSGAQAHTGGFPYVPLVLALHNEGAVRPTVPDVVQALAGRGLPKKKYRS